MRRRLLLGLVAGSLLLLAQACTEDRSAVTTASAPTSVFESDLIPDDVPTTTVEGTAFVWGYHGVRIGKHRMRLYGIVTPRSIDGFSLHAEAGMNFAGHVNGQTVRCEILGRNADAVPVAVCYLTAFGPAEDLVDLSLSLGLIKVQRDPQIRLPDLLARYQRLAAEAREACAGWWQSAPECS